MSRIGVSLSGGGHRASLFGLGALLYLVDAGKNREVTSIASVSGGSLTNAFVAQTMDFRQVTPEQFEEAMKPFATQLARKGTFQGRYLTPRYLLLLGGDGPGPRRFRPSPLVRLAPPLVGLPVRTVRPVRGGPGAVDLGRVLPAGGGVRLRLPADPIHPGWPRGPPGRDRHGHRPRPVCHGTAERRAALLLR